MTLQQWLSGKERYVLNVSSFVSSVVAGVAAVYAGFTIELPAGSLSTFLLLVGLVAGPLIFLSDSLCARWLPTFRALTRSARVPEPAEVTAAIKELRRFPDRLASFTLVMWFVATTTLAVATFVVTGASTSVLGRLFALGAIFAPLCAVLVGLMTTVRAMDAIERLSTAVPVPDAIAALGVPTLNVRARLVILTLVMVGMPAILFEEAGRTLEGHMLERLSNLDAVGQAREFEAFASSLLLQLGVLGALTLFMALLAAWAGAQVIGRPLVRLALSAGRISQGELPRPELIVADGEVWLVTRVFAKMHERLYVAASKLRGAEVQISSVTSTLDLSTQRFATGSAAHAAALNQTSATTEELARSARQIAANATTVLDVARQTLEAADSARGMADALGAAVERMKQDNASIARSVELLGQRVLQVGQVVEFINGVADRTGLLALSAELEGTRAGEVGRGFTLVAGEMRNLAENVLESTREIEELIAEVREATRSTQFATEKGTTFAERGLSFAAEVTRSLDGVTSLTDETSAAVRTISLATQQQQTGTDQLAEAMADILGITQGELDTTRQLEAASHGLQALSKELSSAVGRFRIDA